MSALRGALLAALVVVAVTLQAAVFRYVAVDGVAPNLALVLVVVAAFTRGSQFAAVLGFFTGLLLDVAPPADHVAGRWALALVLVGYLAGRVRGDAQRSRPTALLIVGLCSFVGTSVFALSGMVLGDDAWSVGAIVRVVLIGSVVDVVLALLVLPLLTHALDRLRPPRLAYR